MGTVQNEVCIVGERLFFMTVNPFFSSLFFFYIKSGKVETTLFASSSSGNRQFPEITGDANLTVFSYSWRVKSPEWRRQRRRADLWHFQIFRHGPIIIYTRLPAGGTYYPICMFPTNSERLIGISDTFSAFVYGYPSSCRHDRCTPNKSVTTLPYPSRPGPMYTGHACRHLPSAVPLISEDHLLLLLSKRHVFLLFWREKNVMLLYSINK